MPPTRETTILRQSAFLKGYARTGTVKAAAKAAEIPRQTFYDWLKRDLYSFNARLASAASSTCEDGGGLRAYEPRDYRSSHCKG